MPSPIDFSGRVAIVTGAGRPLGLGAAYVRLLAERGARVVVNDVLDASEVVDEINASGGVAIASDHDIGALEGPAGLVDTAIEAFGGVDAVVNNAGVAPLASFPEMTFEMLERTMRVHVFGSFHVTRHAWPHLVRSGHGRVVMIASKAALWGSTPGLSAYGAAKGALLGLTRQLAPYGAPDGVCVNAVFPTAITSLQHPRMAEVAADLGVDSLEPSFLAARSAALVAALVAWLCHPDCTASGEFFKAQAGQAQLVSFAMNPGIEDHTLTIESVRDHFDTIVDTSQLRVVSPFPVGAKG